MQRIDKEILYPLFWCLSDPAKQLLAEFQWRVYGLKLDIPRMPPHPYLPHFESPEELDRLMRMKPKTKARG